MKKVLIAAGDLKTGENYQQVLSKSGFQTALVWNSIQLVDFCRQNDPDITVIDLDLSGPNMWSSLQAVKGMGALANMPVVGVTTTGDATELNEAKQAGVMAVFPKQEGPESLVETLKTIMSQNDDPRQPSPSLSFEATIAPTENIELSDRGQFGNRESSSLDQLKEIVEEIQNTTQILKPRIEEFGEDGPELFGYIEGSGEEIRTKLGGIGETSLYDHELRHDFRNMIGSVTGFAELILMEPGLSPDSQRGLTRLRECSRDFVEFLDQQKSLAEV